MWRGVVGEEEEEEQEQEGHDRRRLDHSSQLPCRLQDLRSNPATCDVIFVCDPPRRGEDGAVGDDREADACEFPCHRVVLASLGEYFVKLLYGEMLEARSIRVELKDVPADGFRLLVQYVSLR
jgi:hypothetical protein